MNTVESNPLVLASVAKKVEFPLSQEILDFIDKMKEFCLNEKGCLGVAANQLWEGDPEKIPSIFILKVPKGAQEFINPEIKISGPKVNITEGCFSVPGKAVKVKRRLNARIFAQTLESQEIQEFVFFGDIDFNAIVVQHEYDHLIGLTINRL